LHARVFAIGGAQLPEMRIAPVILGESPYIGLATVANDGLRRFAAPFSFSRFS